jgi:hypothetical protein
MSAETGHTTCRPGTDSPPQAQAHRPPAPGVLRVEHVQLTGLVPGLPLLSNGQVRKGWLVLTDRGEFRFYDKQFTSTRQAPAFRAATADEFVQKVGMFGVRVRFRKAGYNMWFTGEAFPDRRSADIEEKTDQAGNVGNAAGTVLTNASIGAGQAISVFGDLLSLAMTILQLSRMMRNRKRRAAAKHAWYPVLSGARPWDMISTGKETTPDTAKPPERHR